MNTMTDNIEQRCYLQYLLSKYISNPCSGSQVQELETCYNAIDCIKGIDCQANYEKGLV